MTTPAEVASAMASGQPVDISVKPPDGVAHRFTEVTVVDLGDETATIRSADGEQHTVRLDTLIDTKASRERQRRRRRWGNLFDLLSFPWLSR